MRDFEKFEKDIVSLISKRLPNFNWSATNKTRDGNKDAISVFGSSLISDSYEAWLEIKYRKNSNKNIGSRAFDSTLVSALQAEKLKALYLATNTPTNKLLYFRISSFCNRALKDLQKYEIIDQKRIDSLYHKTNTVEISDFIFDDIYITHCVDFANHNLTNNKLISSGNFYYLTVAFFNPYKINDKEKGEVITFKLNDQEIDQYKLNESWNFLSFIFEPYYLEGDNSILKISLQYKGATKKLEKKLTLNNNLNHKIFYKESEELNTLIHEKHFLMHEGRAQKCLIFTEGPAASGKSYIHDSVCARWSKSHEILPIQLTGMSSDWYYLEKIVTFCFGAHIGEIDPDTQYKKIDLESVIELIDSLLPTCPRRIKRLLLIDDFHKSESDFTHVLTETIKLVNDLTDWVSVFIFSRPGINSNIFHSK